MKHRDAHVFALAQHLRSAIDLMEQIATEPLGPQPPTPPLVAEDAIAPAPAPELPKERSARRKRRS